MIKPLCNLLRQIKSKGLFHLKYLFQFFNWCHGSPWTSLSLASFSSRTTDAVLQQGFPPARHRGARLTQRSHFHPSQKSNQQLWLLHGAGSDVQMLSSLDPQLFPGLFSSKACIDGLFSPEYTATPIAFPCAELP